MNLRLSFSREARERFLEFATSRDALWAGNFREFNGAIRRMATLCKGGRIGVDQVAEEIERLRDAWRYSSARPRSGAADEVLERHLGTDRAAELDQFDRVQLADVLRACLEAATLSEAGRRLFDVSRTRKRTANDADRLRKYLARFGLQWADLRR
jgi:transcriptional regulatory protein RtcR